MFKGNSGRRILPAVLTALVLVVMQPAALAAPVGSAPWGSNTYSGTSVDEPVADVLQRIGSLAGIGVEMSQAALGASTGVTRQFQNEPLRLAFESLLRAYGFEANYLADANKITIDVQGSDTTAVVVPSSMPLASIQRALRHYGMDKSGETGVTIRTDRATGSIMLSGEASAVASVSRFINTLDRANKARLDEAKKRRDEDVVRRRQVIEQKLLEARLNAKSEVKVFRLRNARVGSSTIVVRGEPVTVPGIDETLRTLLDLEGQDGDAAKRDQQTIQVLSGGGSVGGNDNLLTNIGQLPGKPKTRISLDPRTNSVIVRGDAETIAFVGQILKELDQEVPLVDIEVMILTARAGTARNLGIQWSAASQDRTTGTGGGVSSGGPTNTPGGIVQGTSPTSTSGSSPIDTISLLPLGSVQTAIASFIFSDGGASFLSAQISALAAENKAQVISTPHVVTLNNVTASIEDSTTTHLRIATEAGGAGDIQPVDAGITLNITPSVVDVDNGQSGKGGLVQLSIDAESSTFVPDAPEVTTVEQKIQTRVMLKDKATLVMGGLFTTNRSEVEDGIPGLKDVPLLGFLFRKEESADNRNETIFFITPTVLTPKDIRGHEDINGKMVRDFTEGQQERLTKERRSLESSSQLINLKRLALEEDE
jgi:type II secretory pathway component GspD/PulD (secretin)